MLDLVPGLSERERRVARLMLNNTSPQTYAVSGELVTWIGSQSLAEALLYSEGGALEIGSVLRAVKRARARLVALGILLLVERGGRGRTNTSRFRFAVAALESFERDAARAGVLQRFGAADDGGATLGVVAQGGFGVTQSGVETGLVQGDAGTTLGVAAPVEKAAEAVDIPFGNAAGVAVRVTAGPVQGDAGQPVRVTRSPPEPESNPIKPCRSRGGAPASDPRQREMPLMRNLRGGLDGVVDVVEGAAKARRETRGDRRHEAVLHRASLVLGGDARTSSLAVSTLPAEAIERMRRGWLPSDREFQGLIETSLAALDAAGLRATPPAAPDGDGVGALRGEMRALQVQVTALTRLVTAALGDGDGLRRAG